MESTTIESTGAGMGNRPSGFFGDPRRFGSRTLPQRGDRATRRAPVVPDALLRAARSRAPGPITKMAADGAANFAHRLGQRATLGWTLGVQEQIETLGPEAWLARQLDPGSIDDHGLDQALADALPSLRMRPVERLIGYEGRYEELYFEQLLSTLYRAVYSPRQLFERMVTFWSDHFNIDLNSDFAIWIKQDDDRDVVRRHALGRFRDLLGASAHSPAMLSYLTNDSNVAGHPNENYARELMELHTLGIGGGYSQQDVREVARCFTGWRFGSFDAGLDFGRFVFDASRHDDGVKVVLGETIPAGGGAADGERVLDLLAAHPATSRFLARKLLVYFWGYEPDVRTVERVARVYRDTDGDLRAVVGAVLAWYDLAVATPKLKRPFHLVVSTVRALFAEIENPYSLLEAMLAAGQLPFNWAPPNGYPDSAGYWSGFVLPRWGFAAGLWNGALRVDLPFLTPDLGEAGLIDVLDVLLTGGTLSSTSRTALLGYLDQRGLDEATLGEVVGLVVASPVFQHY